MSDPVINLIEPGGPRPVHSIRVDEPPQFDDSAISSEDTEDGGLSVTVGQSAKPKTSRRGNFDENLAEDMDSLALAALGSWLLDGIEADQNSRREWEDTANRVADYLGIQLDAPADSASADGTICNTIATCMLEAAIKLWGVARAELLPVGGPVKTRRDDVPPAKDFPQPSPMEEPDGHPSVAGAGQSPVAPGVGGIPGMAPPAPAAPPPQMGGPMAGPPVGGGNPPASSGPGGIAAPQSGIAAPPGPLDDGQPLMPGDDLALALETDMNHYLTTVDRGYYPDFSKMLMNRLLIGLAFRKVYRCPLLRRPVSRWVKAQDLIVSNDTSHLDDAGRITERIRLRQATMRRMQIAGHYLDIPLVRPTGQTSQTEEAVAQSEGVTAQPTLPEDQEHLVYECYCEIGSGTNHSLMGDISDLEEDEKGRKVGFPLPYRVSIDYDSREILEIRRNWKEGDEDYRPRRRYIKYGYIPGTGFYDLGLIHIVGNPTQAATMIQRSSIDTGLFANFPGGLFIRGPGSRQSNTVLRPNPGEWLPIDAAGAQRIQDVFMPMPYKPPSPETLELGAKLESDVRRLAGVVELPVGEGRISNTPVGTIMAYIESVSQVPGAVHKDDHISQQDEFELLRELFVEDPAALTRGVKRPARRWQIAQELMDPELVPAADPNTPSEVHRLMKVQGMVTLSGLPQFGAIANQRAIYKWAASTLTGDKADEFTTPEAPPTPPPPPPQVIAAQIKAQSQQQSDQMKLKVETVKAQDRMTELQQEGQQRDADRQSAERRAAISEQTARIKAAADAASGAADRTHDTANQAAQRAMDHAHHVDTSVQAATDTAVNLPTPEPQGGSSP